MNREFWLYQDKNSGSIHFSPEPVVRDELELINHVIEMPAYTALEEKLYRKGVHRCEKCKFVGVSSFINANTGNISPNDKPKICPNGCGPLWRITWREACLDAEETIEKFFAQNKRLRQVVQSCFEIMKASGNGVDQQALSAVTCYAKEVLK